MIEYPIVHQEEDKYFVVSKNGQVLGKFDTPEGAEDFKRNYTALKSFSSTVNELGNEEAMKRFREKIKKNLMGG